MDWNNHANPVLPRQITYLTLDGDNVPQGHRVIMTNVPIGLWIESQPCHMWRFLDMPQDRGAWQISNHYVVSDQLLAWLRLRWE